MKTSYIEQMNAVDRNNSLHGYFNSLYREYTDFLNPNQTEVGAAPDYSDSMRFLFGSLSFASTLRGVTKSVTETREKYYNAEEFGALKFRLAKNLNLIESLLYKICHDTIDSSIINEESSIEDVKQAIIWQFVDCVDETDPVYQDSERVRQIISAAVRKKWESNGKRDGEEGFNEDLKTQEEYLFKSDRKRETMRNYKIALRAVLGDLFRVLSNLVNFSQYLAVVEEMPGAYPSSGAQDMEYLRKRPTMEHILDLAETVKQLILQYLTSYVKVKQLNLPHSFLSGARFMRSVLYDSNLMASELTDGAFAYATLRDCDLSMCALNNINAHGADFTGATLNYVTLAGADLSDAVLNDAAINSVVFFDSKLVDIATYNFSNLIPFIYGKSDNAENYALSRFQCAGAPEKDIKTSVIDALSRSAQPSGNPILKKTLDIDMSWKVDGKTDVPVLAEKMPRKIAALLDFTDEDRKQKGINNDLEQVLGSYKDSALTRYPTPQLLSWLESSFGQSVSNLLHVEVNELNFRPASLRNASVKRSFLPNSDLSYVALAGASFDDTDLNSSRFTYNNAVTARMSNANISKSRFFRCDFSDASFHKANAVAVEFVNTRLSGASFDNALLLGARFYDTTHTNSYTAYVFDQGVRDKPLEPRATSLVWRDAVYADSDMQDCNFQHCIASESAFVGIDLDRSSLSGADFKKAFFSNCLMRWCDLFKTNLSYSLILGVMFDRSSLQQVILPNARLFACIFDENTFTSANLTSCRMDNVIFNNCDFSGANLSHARFVNCGFFNVNFEDASLSKARFKNCRFSESTIDKAKNPMLSVHQNSTIMDKTTKENLEAMSLDTSYFEFAEGETGGSFTLNAGKYD